MVLTSDHEMIRHGQPLVRIATAALAVALIVNVFRLFVAWYGVSPFGYGGEVLSFLASAVVVLMILVCFLAAPASLLLLPFHRTRVFGCRLLIGCVFFFGVTVAFGWYAPDPRLSAFRNLAERSKPLVSAIHSYTDDHGSPPAGLEDLVPDYMEEIPGTGIPRYPDYEYTTDEGWDGNPWVLYVHTPRGLINWDMFMYFPLQNYPVRGYGGVLKRINDWVYVYE